MKINRHEGSKKKFKEVIYAKWKTEIIQQRYCKLYMQRTDQGKIINQYMQ